MGKNTHSALTLLAHKKAKRKTKKQTQNTPSSSAEVNQVKSLTQRLTHSDPSFRQKALVALVNLNIEENEKAAQALISPEVLHAILASLSDPLQNIKLTGLSVIMGLLQTEYVSEVANFFLENDLLACLYKIIQDIETQLTAFVQDRTLKPILDHVSFIRSIAALLENLLQQFENQALETIIESQVSQWILRFFLSESQFLPDVAKACAEYIYAIALQSQQCLPILLQNLELLEGRLSTPHQAYLEMQAYIAGILYHVYQEKGLMEQKMQHILGPFLAGVFERDCVSQFFLNIEPVVLKHYDKGKKSKGGSDETSSTAEEEEKLNKEFEQQKQGEGVIRTWKNSIQANLVMFEILIDLVALPLEGDADEEEDWEDQEGEEAKEQTKEGDKNEGRAKAVLPAAIAQELLEGEFLDGVYQKFKFKGLTEDLIAKLKGHPPFYEKVLLPIQALRTSAAQTLGNVLLFHELPNMSKEIGSMVWSLILEIVMLAGQQDVLIVESLLRLLKALLENESVKGYFDLEAIATDVEMQFLVEWLYGEEERGKVAAVGLLGSILSQKRHSLEENAKVWELLINLCKSGNLELVAETLNALFDIYSEDYYDEVLRAQSALKILELGRVELAKMIETCEKKYSGLEMQHFQETGLNLERFIAYKREEMK